MHRCNGCVDEPSKLTYSILSLYLYVIKSTYLATSLGFTPGSKGHTQCKAVVEGLYKMFRAHDCTLVEVNPLAETPEGNVMVCDAKINFDDNAEFRQSAVFKHRDRTQEDPREVEVRTVCFSQCIPMGPSYSPHLIHDLY